MRFISSCCVEPAHGVGARCRPVSPSNIDDEFNVLDTTFWAALPLHARLHEFS